MDSLREFDLAEKILDYVTELRSYWRRRGVQDGKIHVTVTPGIPGATHEVAGKIFGCEVVVERPPKRFLASVEIGKSPNGFDIQFGKSSVQVEGGPVYEWANKIWQDRTTST